MKHALTVYAYEQARQDRRLDGARVDGTPARMPASWQRRLPFVSAWPPLNRRTLSADLWAGITGAVIVLPQGVAYALLAGLPPEYGLYTAIVPAIVAALFGSSWHLISGPTAAISIVVFSTLSTLAPLASNHYVELAITAAGLTGAIQLTLGLARLGALVNFVSHTVVTGFTAGAAILIVTSQLKAAFGVPVPAGESFVHSWLMWYQQLDETNLYALSVALATLLTAVAIRCWRPRWPSMLIAMLTGAMCSLALDGAAHGVPLVGAIPSRLPPFSPPDTTFDTLRELAPSTLAIALLGLVEASSIARAIAARSGQSVDGNREFIGQGLSNLVGSFFSCYPASGSFTRTGVNYEAGAMTPLAALAAALVLMLIMLLAAPFAAYLPIPAMAGMLVLVALNLIEFNHIKHILLTDKAESAVLLTTFLATLFVGLEFAVYAGVLLSVVLYLNRTSRPNILTLAPDPQDLRRRLVNIERTPLPECPQLKMLRIGGSLFFGAADYVEKKLLTLSEQTPDQRHLLLIGTGMNFVDMTGAELLAREGDRRRAIGGSLSLVGVNTRVHATLEHTGAVKRISQVYTSKHEAIASLFERLDMDTCARCTRRIFIECAKAPMNAETAAKRETGQTASCGCG